MLQSPVMHARSVLNNLTQRQQLGALLWHLTHTAATPAALFVLQVRTFAADLTQRQQLDALLQHITPRSTPITVICATKTSDAGIFAAAHGCCRCAPLLQT